MIQENNNDYKNIFTKFVSICERNNLWYSLANNSLLSAMTNTNYFENIGILEVFVTYETFLFIKNKYPDNIMDFASSDSFYLPTPFFYVKNLNKFIKIIILTPTSVDKVNKVYKLSNKVKNQYSNFLTFKKGYNLSTKLMFNFFRLFSMFFCPIEQNKLFDSLYHEDYRGFIAINSLNESSVKNWFPNITFQMENIDFLGVNTKIIKEYDKLLIARYGETWRNGVKIKHVSFNYEKLIIE